MYVGNGSDRTDNTRTSGIYRNASRVGLRMYWSVWGARGGRECVWIVPNKRRAESKMRAAGGGGGKRSSTLCFIRWSEINARGIYQKYGSHEIYFFHRAGTCIKSTRAPEWCVDEYVCKTGFGFFYPSAPNRMHN